MRTTVSAYLLHERQRMPVHLSCFYPDFILLFDLILSWSAKGGDRCFSLYERQRVPAPLRVPVSTYPFPLFEQGEYLVPKRAKRVLVSLCEHLSSLAHFVHFSLPKMDKTAPPVLSRLSSIWVGWNVGYLVGWWMNVNVYYARCESLLVKKWRMQLGTQ